MATQRIQQGELAYWLGVIAAASSSHSSETESTESFDNAPAHIVEALQILSCIRAQDGAWVITEKGRLSLRMADPAAIHRH